MTTFSCRCSLRYNPSLARNEQPLGDLSSILSNETMTISNGGDRRSNGVDGKLTMSESSIILAKNLFCGGIAGTTACIIGHPLDLIKIRLQTQPDLYTSAYSCFRQTIRDEGYRSFYRGMTAPLLSQFFQTGLMFAGESIATHYLKSFESETDQISRSSVNVFLAGSFGGLVKCLVLVPTDLIKCNMQVDQGNRDRGPKYSGSFDCFQKIYNDRGIRGLYKGFAVTTLREVPSFGFYFFVYRNSLNFLDTHFYNEDNSESLISSFGHERSSKPGVTTFIAGGLAGTVSWICIYPFDVLKSHTQTSKNKNCINGGNGLSLIETAANLYRQHGFRAFTRGLGVTIARAFPVNGSMLLTHEYLKYTLQY